MARLHSRCVKPQQSSHFSTRYLHQLFYYYPENVKKSVSWHCCLGQAQMGEKLGDHHKSILMPDPIFY